MKNNNINEYGFLINGRWITKEKKDNVPIYAPYEGELLAYVTSADSKDVDMAVENAKTTFETKSISNYQRYEILSRASVILKERKDNISKTLAMEAGKPLKYAKAEVDRAAQTLLISAEEAKRIHGEQIPVEAVKGSEKRLAFTIREPVGVVCAISPFNFPLNLAAHKVGPALAAGNTVVLKPAFVTPLSAINLANALMDAGLPPGFLNVIFGHGNKVGEQLLSDKRFDLYSFTGSPEIGKKIREIVGLRRTILELGSNSAVIINKDADLNKAVPACITAAYAYSGQVCISLQRIYVHKDIAAEFNRMFVKEVGNLKIGDPLDENTDVGPMINEYSARKIEEWIKEAVLNGAELLCGGTRKDNILYPAVLSKVKRDMKVVCLEAFAPIVSIIEYSEIEDAVNQVNDSIFGLQAGIFTSDINTAFYAAKKLKVGGVLINDTPMYRVDSMPYGGIKESGIGREGPKYTIEQMTNMKLIVMNL